MFTSLSQFYTSQDWRKFRAQVIADSMQKNNGSVIDELTGEVIVKSYDIVLHHKIPLTMQNVNDFSISLNRDNIMIVSQKSHRSS